MSARAPAGKQQPLASYPVMFYNCVGFHSDRSLIVSKGSRTDIMTLEHCRRSLQSENEVKNVQT